MHHHHQFSSAVAAAAAAATPTYPGYQSFYSQQNSLDANNQWQLPQNPAATQLSEMQQQQPIQQHQHQYQHQHHHQQQQDQQAQQIQQHYQNLNMTSHHNFNHVANQCDTNSMAAAVVAANTFAQYHLDQQQHQHQQHYNQHNHHPHHHAQLQQTNNHHQNLNFQQQLQNHHHHQNQQDTEAAPTSAINELQVFALSTPEAATVVSSTPFYPAPAAITRSLPASNTNSSKIQKTRGLGTKSKQAAKRIRGNATTTTIQRDNNNQSAPAADNQTKSRSQRRYAGRASCDCPNCNDLERLRRLGLEPPDGSGEAPSKKLVHICHHAGCCKEYEKTSHLRAHLRWHTTERLSACRHPDCGKSFNRADELRKHMKTHHSQPSITKVQKTSRE